MEGDGSGGRGRGTDRRPRSTATAPSAAPFHPPRSARSVGSPSGPAASSRREMERVGHRRLATRWPIRPDEGQRGLDEVQACSWRAPAGSARSSPSTGELRRPLPVPRAARRPLPWVAPSLTRLGIVRRGSRGGLGLRLENEPRPLSPRLQEPSRRPRAPHREKEWCLSSKSDGKAPPRPQSRLRKAPQGRRRRLRRLQRHGRRALDARVHSRIPSGEFLSRSPGPSTRASSRSPSGGRPRSTAAPGDNAGAPAADPRPCSLPAPPTPRPRSPPSTSTP